MGWVIFRFFNYFEKNRLICTNQHYCGRLSSRDWWLWQSDRQLWTLQLEHFLSLTMFRATTNTSWLNIRRMQQIQYPIKLNYEFTLFRRARVERPISVCVSASVLTGTLVTSRNAAALHVVTALPEETRDQQHRGFARLEVCSHDACKVKMYIQIIDSSHTSINIKNKIASNKQKSKRGLWNWISWQTTLKGDISCGWIIVLQQATCLRSAKSAIP